MDRRHFLQCAGCTALGWSLQQKLAWAAEMGDGQSLAPRPTHRPPQAKQLIVVFLTGGFSHVDTFDFKPKLKELNGQQLVTRQLRENQTGKLMASPFRFTQSGDSGLWFSELFPSLSKLADDLCVIRTMHTDIIEHFQAALAMHTGSSTIPLPSIGAWLSFGLGTFNPNLPSYLVFAEHMPYGGAQVWDSSFLPPIHQGVRVVPGSDPIPNLRDTSRDVTLQELEQVMLEDANRIHAEARPDDLNLRARSASFETARGMMHEAPETFDVGRETAETMHLYGLEPGDTKSFAWQCLMTRRLIERGVRVVELIDTGASDNWDAHGDMQAHVPKARRVDQPLAAMLLDLKRRGLLNDTLVAICTEFGRTPTTFNGTGREHFVDAFSCLLAGAGVRGGMAYGETDELGMTIARDGVHVHDYHATILHLMGIDHTRLTYRYAGRDFRLTDVHGSIVQPVLS